MSVSQINLSRAIFSPRKCFDACHCHQRNLKVLLKKPGSFIWWVIVKSFAINLRKQITFHPSKNNLVKLFLVNDILKLNNIFGNIPNRKDTREVQRKNLPAWVRIMIWRYIESLFTSQGFYDDEIFLLANELRFDCS